MSVNRLFAAVLVSISFFPAALQAQEPAGRVLWSFGKVERVSSEGKVTTLMQGDAVLQGDIIQAGASSHAQLLMNDEALVAVRPESRLRLETYTFKGLADGSERALIELLRGGMRAITGAIGRTNKDNFLIRTQTHLIGIRGTDHETFATDAGTYNRVTAGGTYLQGPGGRLDLSPGETGFLALLPDAAPTRLERTPQFMQLALQSSVNTGPRLRESAVSDQRLLSGVPIGAPGVPQQGASPVPQSATPAAPGEARGVAPGEATKLLKELPSKGGKGRGLNR